MNQIKEVLQKKEIKHTSLDEKLGKCCNIKNCHVQNCHRPRLELLNEIANILGVDIKNFNCLK